MARKELESKFQRDLKDELYEMFEGCFILKNNANLIQGIPDLLILWGNTWAALEVKRSLTEPYRPNQEWYLELFDDMSFAAMICPENKEDVLHGLRETFLSRR